MTRLCFPARLPLLLAAAAGPCLADPAKLPAAPGIAGPSLLPLLGGLIVVLAMIPAAAWLLRRAGIAQRPSVSGLRVVSQLALGPRERVVIVEAGERRWLLGVSAAGITRLGTLPPGSRAEDAPGAEPTPGRFADLIKRFAPPR